MCEIQRWYKQKAILDVSQTKRALKFIGTVMEKEATPDLIVAHMPTAILSVLEQIYPNVKKVAVLHQTDVINCGDDLNRSKRINNIFSKIYARSKAIRDFGRSISIKVENDIVYSGVSIDLKKVKGKTKPEKFRIIYVGKLIKRKNVDKVIQCIAEIDREIYFDIYGAGPELENLKKLAVDSGTASRVKLHGQVSHDKVAEIMRDADIFIMISTGETFGLVYLEALSAGNIVIGSKNEGIDGVIVDGENGFLVDPNSQDELKICFEKIFSMSGNEYTEISQKANNTALEFSEEKMGRRYLSLIQSCII